MGNDDQNSIDLTKTLGRLGLPSVIVSREGRIQRQVLQLLAEGGSTEQIAAELHLSTETVRNHIRHVLKGLGAHSRLEAVVVARRQGIMRDS
jgi:DNA-binding NarL/FixJ family response regulator